eukprot:5962884-Prymnesium_polylepis.1
MKTTSESIDDAVCRSAQRWSRAIDSERMGASFVWAVLVLNGLHATTYTTFTPAASPGAPLLRWLKS